MQLRLGRAVGSRKGSTVDNLKASKDRASHPEVAPPTRARVETGSDDEDEPEDHLPTARELAESFLDHEPDWERKELETVIHNVVQQQGDKSDAASDEEFAGTGVGLPVPSFLANFLKGVINRLQVTISNVKFILDADLTLDDDLPTVDPSVSVQFGVTSVSIEGFTHATDQITQDKDSDRGTREKLRIHLEEIYGELITESYVLKPCASFGW